MSLTSTSTTTSTSMSTSTSMLKSTSTPTIINPNGRRRKPRIKRFARCPNCTKYGVYLTQVTVRKSGPGSGHVESERYEAKCRHCKWTLVGTYGELNRKIKFDADIGLFMPSLADPGSATRERSRAKPPLLRSIGRLIKMAYQVGVDYFAEATWIQKENTPRLSIEGRLCRALYEDGKVRQVFCAMAGDPRKVRVIAHASQRVYSRGYVEVDEKGILRYHILDIPSRNKNKRKGDE